MMAGFVACDVIYGALGSELFPTAYRSTASGLRAVATLPAHAKVGELHAQALSAAVVLGSEAWPGAPPPGDV